MILAVLVKKRLRCQETASDMSQKACMLIYINIKMLYSGSERVMSEWLGGLWIVGAISFQKIFGLCGLNGHIVENW